MLILVLFLSLASLFSGRASADTPTYSDNLIPKMTSNTSPSGIASASTEWSSIHQAFSAFNKDNEDKGWATREGVATGWIAYEFAEPQKVNHYTITPRSQHLNNAQESPKDWTFEGWDGEKWVVLDTQTGITGWVTRTKKEFSFSNNTSYKKYRLNITKNNGYASYVTIGEIEMMSLITPPESTNPGTPDPVTPSPNGDRAILVVTMITGLEKEYDLPLTDVEAFMSWYDAKGAGIGPAKFAINKYTNNKGPFNKRTDYVIFDKILTFEVSEYSAK